MHDQDEAKLDISNETLEELTKHGRGDAAAMRETLAKLIAAIPAEPEDQAYRAQMTLVT